MNETLLTNKIHAIVFDASSKGMNTFRDVVEEGATSREDVNFDSWTAVWEFRGPIGHGLAFRRTFSIPGQQEIGQFNVAMMGITSSIAFENQNVSRVDVSMEDGQLVEVLQSLSHLK